MIPFRKGRRNPIVCKQQSDWVLIRIAAPNRTVFVAFLTNKSDTTLLDLPKAKLFLEATFFIIIFTYLKLIVQVQNGQEVLNRLVLCLKCMELACRVLHGHFAPVYLLQVSKSDDEKPLLHEIFGFRKIGIQTRLHYYILFFFQKDDITIRFRLLHLHQISLTEFTKEFVYLFVYFWNLLEPLENGGRI